MHNFKTTAADYPEEEEEDHLHHLSAFPEGTIAIALGGGPSFPIVGLHQLKKRTNLLRNNNNV